MKKKTIILYSFISILLLYIIGQVLSTSYFISLGTKLVLFLAVPILINRYLLKQRIPFHMTLKNLKFMLMTSAAVIIVIIATYAIVQSFIDVSVIREDFIARQKSTKPSFCSQSSIRSLPIPSSKNSSFEASSS